MIGQLYQETLLTAKLYTITVVYTKKHQMKSFPRVLIIKPSSCSVDAFNMCISLIVR